MLKLRDAVGADCSAGKNDACFKDILDTYTAAKAAPGLLPAAPACLKSVDTMARAGFGQIQQGASATVDAATAAAATDAQVKAATDAINAGAAQLGTAATDGSNAKC